MLEIIPFLIATFLFINPLLEWLFRKREVAAEKLQFWVMVTTGTAWVISLIFFLLDPDGSIAPGLRPGIELIPQLYFSFDWISTALILAAAGLIFITVLTRQDRPAENAWLAGMAGACVIGLGAYSAYTLALAWVILEAFHFHFSYRDQLIASNPRKFLPVALIRLAVPAVLIALSLTLEETGVSSFDDMQNPWTGSILIGAGLVGFLGWFLSYKSKDADQPGYFSGAPENWIPGLLGMMLMIRGGGMAGTGITQGSIALILSALLFLFSLAGLMLDRSPGLWFLLCGLMVAVSALISSPESALSWGVVMVLPATRFWRISGNPRSSLILLTLALIGLLPFPFLPAWLGVLAFKEGLAGIFLGLSYGILVGSALLTGLKNWNAPGPEPESHPAPGIIGAAGVLISQIIIAFRLGLVDSSQGLLGKPIWIWISLLGIVPVLILGNHIPLKKKESWMAAGLRLRGGLSRVLSIAIGVVDRLVVIISRVFEGQGGLIWALLIGLLIITLISLRGG
jgi:hypothetical protein